MSYLSWSHQLHTKLLTCMLWPSYIKEKYNYRNWCKYVMSTYATEVSGHWVVNEWSTLTVTWAPLLQLSVITNNINGDVPQITFHLEAPLSTLSKHSQLLPAVRSWGDPLPACWDSVLGDSKVWILHGCNLCVRLNSPFAFFVIWYVNL